MKPKAPSSPGQAVGEDWRAALFARRGGGMKFDLAALRAMDQALGYPASGAQHVQVLGTNGKGSTAAMLAWGLQHAGTRVGLFTSPHLHRAGERVRVDFEPASDPQLQAAVDEVLAHEGAAGRPLSFFEVLTLAALVHFERAQVQVVILEAGLGGRLDATSLRRADLCLLCSLAMDHEAWLGNTLGKIAAEKVGAMQAGQPCLHLIQAPEAQVAIEAQRERGTDFVELAPLDWAPIEGEHQRGNAALAWGAMLLLGAISPSAEPRDVWRGLRWPGRAERMAHGAGRLIFDVAHNPQSLAALSQQCLAMPPEHRPTQVLFGAAQDKDRKPMLASLATLGVRITEVQPAGPRGEGGASMPRADDPELHAQLAQALHEGACVLVCGSHFVVAPIRAWALNLGTVDMDPPELTDPVFQRAQGGPEPQ